jgi:hypothetical protein
MTLMSSPIYSKLGKIAQYKLAAAKYVPYTRLELGIQAFGEMICLATENLSSTEMLTAFDAFKVWCIERSFMNSTSLDETLSYIKWLSKVAQSAILQVNYTEPPIQAFCQNGVLMPFVGDLKFIDDLFQTGKRRTSKLTYLQSASLAQIANTSRALPYPSDQQVKESIRKTIETFTTESSVGPVSRKAYVKGLHAMKDRLDSRNTNSHVSLVGNGSHEKSRSQGGRARYLIGNCRLATDLPAKGHAEKFVGKFDQFGILMMSRLTLKTMNDQIKKTGVNLTLGDVLYCDPAELLLRVEKLSQGDKLVPLHLVHILNNVASKLMLSVGKFTPAHEAISNLIAFTEPTTRFQMTGILPVKADVSIESGMKARLVTSAMAGFSHLSQLPSNKMRAILSKDPFCRVGFNEADKLWAVMAKLRDEE